MKLNYLWLLLVFVGCAEDEPIDTSEGVVIEDNIFGGELNTDNFTVVDNVVAEPSDGCKLSDLPECPSGVACRYRAYQCGVRIIWEDGRTGCVIESIETDEGATVTYWPPNDAEDTSTYKIIASVSCPPIRHETKE